MGTLYLVRHGQASFGAADYDQLSELGTRQCVRLGEHFRARGLRFDAVLRGSLRRHRQSLDAIAHGMRVAPDALEWPGLNEYDSDALVAAQHPAPLAPPTSPEAVRQHFRVLRDALGNWMAGRLQPQGMPSFTAFGQGVAGALEHVRTHHTGDVLLVSSGGPISVAVGQVLRLQAPAVIELNLRLRNSAVSEFVVTPRRHSLLSFNTMPHLDPATHADWISYA